MELVVVDPGHQVPNYDHALAAALVALGHRVVFATAPLLAFEPAPTRGVALNHAFGRLLGRSIGGRWSSAERPGLRRLIRLIGYGPELATFIRQTLDRRPDIVHFQWSLVPPLDAAVLRRLRGRGIPVVYTAHNVVPHEERPWHTAAYRGLYRSVDRVTVHSAASQQRLQALTGLTEDRVHVIPMPADEPVDMPSRSAARIQLGLPADVPLVLFFGQVRPYKGLELLLDACPALAQRCPQARLVVAGHIAGGPGAASALHRSLVERGIAPAVDLRPGYVPSAQVSAYFAAADVVALPYRVTDDSAVLAAARGHGRATVATAVGGLPDAMAAGGGLLVPPADAVALSEALARVLGSPDLRLLLEAEARAAARAWTWLDAARRLSELYAELIAQAAR